MSEYFSSIRELIGTRMLLMPSVSVIIRDDAGRFLLAHQTDQNVWNTVGGAMEPLEHPEETARREAQEEVGIELGELRLHAVCGGPEFVSVYSNGDEVSYVPIVFEAISWSGEPTPDMDEIDEVRWFTREEILFPNVTQATVAKLQRFL